MLRARRQGIVMAISFQELRKLDGATPVGKLIASAPRRIPFTLSVVAVMLIAAVVTGALWTPLSGSAWWTTSPTACPRSRPAVGGRRVTGSFFAPVPAAVRPGRGRVPRPRRVRGAAPRHPADGPVTVLTQLAGRAGDDRPALAHARGRLAVGRRTPGGAGRRLLRRGARCGRGRDGDARDPLAGHACASACWPTASWPSSTSARSGTSSTCSPSRSGSPWARAWSGAGST